MVSRMVTFSGAEYVMPRSSNSAKSYFNCSPTGSPHLLQKSGVLALYVPHLVHSTSPRWNGSVFTVEPQLRQGGGGLPRRAAITAGGAQMVQPLEVAALALPVADGELDEIELRHVAEVGNRKHRLEHRLQSRVVTLAGQRIHLQKAVVGTLLHLNEVGNLDCRRNLGKIKPRTVGCFLLRHVESS